MDEVDVFQILKQFFHYFMHLIFPGVIAWVFFRKEWKKVWLLLVGTMLVDLDHLLADPIFDPNRCSIGFHVLHSYYAIAIYVLLLYFPKFRILALGLLLHMFTDFQDYYFW